MNRTEYHREYYRKHAEKRRAQQLESQRRVTARTGLTRYERELLRVLTSHGIA